MSALQIKTFADLTAAVREELKISATDLNSVSRIKRDLNIVYSEVVNNSRWWWLQQNTTVQINEFFANGSCTVLQNKSKVVFTTPIGSDKTGYYFSIEGDNEIYRIESHTPGDNFIRLERRYINSSSIGAGFKIWTDRIPLPTNLIETFEITCTLGRAPLENMGLQEFRRLTSMLPKRQGIPECYYTGDFVEPTATTPIAGMPNLISRESDGMIKKLIFDAALPATIVPGLKIKISRADDPSYNGEVMVAAVSQSTVAGDTFIYTGSDDWTEIPTPDLEIRIEQVVTTTNSSRHRSLFVYPSITSTRVGLSVDYNKAVPPLENDLDEPIMPIDDRIVLLYGALHRAWRRERNPEESASNLALYKEKLGRMAGKIQDTLDKPLLRPSRLYLAAKRSSLRSRRFNFAIDGFLGATQSNSSGGTNVAILGTPNTVAIYDANGALSSSVVTTAQLNFISGATSNIQTQINTLSAALAALSIVDAQVNAAANIQRSKLAPGAASAVVVNNGSGVMTDSSVTSTELSFLSGVIPLTSVSIPNNQVAPAPVLSIPLANSFCFIIYSIQRQNIFVEGGTMVLLNDGSSADLTIDSSQTGSTGVTISADVLAGQVRVLATSTNTGFAAAFKYAVIKWAA